MSDRAAQQGPVERPQGPDAAGPSVAASEPVDPPTRPREIGGREGPEPTRFGDWEKNGRCIDF